MIKAYFRPKTIQEAVDLLSSPNQKMVPLGGGTILSQNRDHEVAVVDLQECGLDRIAAHGSLLRIGATATLQTIGAHPGLSEHLREAVSKEANVNIRQKATIAGCVVSSDGRSVFLTALLALDSTLSWLPGSQQQGIGAFLLSRDKDWPGKFIEWVAIPLSAKLRVASVGRSPADLPVICVSLAVWPTGRVRIALGGFGPYPILAMDSPESDGAEYAVRDALTNSGDAWASAEYRQETAAMLVRRLLTDML